MDIDKDTDRHFEALAYCPVCRARESAVRFRVFVVQVNGDVTARQECDSRTLQSNPITRHLIQEFSSVLQERFAGNPEKRGKFHFPTDGSARYRFKWDQFNPLSALRVVEVAKKSSRR
jgi:hypothetical protein